MNSAIRKALLKYGKSQPGTRWGKRNLKSCLIELTMARLATKP